MDDNSFDLIKIKRRRKEQSLLSHKYASDNNIKKPKRHHLTSITLKTFKFENALMHIRNENVSKTKTPITLSSFMIKKIKYILSRDREKYSQEFNQNYNKMFIYNLLIKEKNILKTKYIEALCCYESKEILLHYYSITESRIMIFYLASLFNKFSIIYPSYLPNETIYYIMMNYLASKEEYIERTEQNQKEYLLRKKLNKFNLVNSDVDRDDTKFFNSLLSDSSDLSINYKYKLNLYTSNKNALNYFECENSVESFKNINTLIDRISKAEKTSGKKDSKKESKKNITKVNVQNENIDTNSAVQNRPIKILNFQENLKLHKNSDITNRCSVISETKEYESKEGIISTDRNKGSDENKKNNNEDRIITTTSNEDNKIKRQFKSGELFLLDSLRKKLSNKERLRNSISKIIDQCTNNEKTESKKNINIFKTKKHKTNEKIELDCDNNKNVALSPSGNADLKDLKFFPSNDFHHSRNKLINNNYYHHSNIGIYYSSVFNHKQKNFLKTEKSNKERIMPNVNYLTKNKNITIDNKKNKNSKIYIKNNNSTNRSQEQFKLILKSPKNSEKTINRSNKELSSRNKKFQLGYIDPNKGFPLFYINTSSTIEKNIHENHRRLYTFNNYRVKRLPIS